MNRRVLHVLQPTEAGVANVALALAADQRARGWQVTVACPPEGSAWHALVAGDFDARAWPATRSPGPRSLREAARLARIVREVDPDIVHLHSSKAGFAGRLAVRDRVPTIFQPHGWSFLAIEGSLRALAVRWERLATRWVDTTVLVSEGEADISREVAIGGRQRVLANGVDIDRFVPATAADRTAARGASDLSSTAPVAVCVGRLCHQKGQNRLVEAWPAVRDAVPDAVLVLVGDGPDQAELEAAATHGVRFVGARADVRPWLAAADFAVFPSRWEGMSLALLEAMASGLAIVATDVAGVRDVVDATCGIVVAPHARDELVAGLIALYRSAAVRTELGAAARTRAVDSFAWQNTADTWAAVYDEILTRRGSRPPR